MTPRTIRNAINPAHPRGIAWDLTQAVLRVDLDDFAPPREVVYAPKWNFQFESITTPTTTHAYYEPHHYRPIQHPYQDDPLFNPASLDPYHHIAHWQTLGFTVPEISSVAGIPAGDAKRLSEGKDVGRNTTLAVLQSVAKFESCLK